MKVKWPSFGFGALAGVLVASLVAVGLDEPWASDDTGLEKGPLVIISGKDQSNGGQRQELVDQWNKTHPDNPARIEELALGADDQYAEMVARAQGPGVKPDIYNLDVTWTAEFAKREYIAPLDESKVDTAGFMATPLRTCRYDGKLWALPFNTDAGLLFYRDPGVKTPRTWTDIVDETRRLMAGPHDPRMVAGYTTQLADYEGLVVNTFEAVWDENGQIVDEDNKVVIDSPEAQAGLHRLANGLKATADSRVIMQEAQNQDETASMNAFGEGKVAFMRNWPVAYRNLHSLTSDDANQPAFFKVAPLPGPSVLGGQNLAISAKSPRPNAAGALIQFLTSPRSQQILFERGGFAATRDLVYSDAEVQRQRPYAEVLREAINTAKLRPVTPCYQRFAKIFRAVVKDALKDSGTLPSDATQRLTDALNC
nr:extracellular solute-binding protein [Kibdelosporangium sp. MJ126-NF4]CEL14501.1 Maltose/maltodextrin ABC transporter, substrate binding periplasmic protein MalE [Kibdelosporangium sp. MJ126-NF4]CTQ88866.1 Maltose/maltodextrin ABC transporter, substrate binding periplasmic protein MalE [Kibdelosporangium sp. MJ126-NF4]